MAGVEYAFTFLAVSTGQYQFYAAFEPTVGAVGSVHQAGLSNTAFNQFTITGTASSTSSDVYIVSDGTGGPYVAALDLEAAPARVADGEIASVCMAFAGLAVQRLPRRNNRSALGLGSNLA